MRILDFSSDPGGVLALVERRWEENRDVEQRVRGLWMRSSVRGMPR